MYLSRGSPSYALNQLNLESNRCCTNALLIKFGNQAGFVEFARLTSKIN